MRGWNLRIFAIDLYCAVASGNSNSLTSSTRTDDGPAPVPIRPCSLASTQNSALPSIAMIENRL